MSPSTTLATVATGVFSKLRSKPLPLDVGCGLSSETAVISDPSYIAARLPRSLLDAAATPFAGSGLGGNRSSERTLSRTSSWAPSLVELIVAELDEANSPNDKTRKAARELPFFPGDPPTLPTRTIAYAILLQIITVPVVHHDLLTLAAYLATEYDRNNW